MDPVLKHIPLLLHLAGFAFLIFSGIFRKPDMMQGVPSRAEMAAKLSTFRDGLYLFILGSSIAFTFAFLDAHNAKMLLHGIIILVVFRLIMFWNEKINQVNRNPFQ